MLIPLIDVPRKISRIMNIDSNEQIFHILLVHYEDSIPIQIEDRYINRSFAPDFLDQGIEARLISIESAPIPVRQPREI